MNLLFRSLTLLAALSLSACYPWVTPDQFEADNPPCTKLAWFADADGDGFGAEDSVTHACEAPDKTASNADDCDDSDPAIRPSALDIPYDGIDQDCDGEDLCDVDGDGHLALVCGGEDCDDDVATTFPFAPEVPYDGVDQDCANGDLCDVDFDGLDHASCPGGTDCDDDDVSVGVVTWYPDADGDGFGDDTALGNACVPADGSDVTDRTDCDDGNGVRYPGYRSPAPDLLPDLVADGVDNNCDGLPGVDDDGDEQASVASGGDDCDDGDPLVYAGAADVVGNGVDNNCDGVPGVDADGDGVASEDSDGADCDDVDPLQFPTAIEVCNGEDDDCDGTPDNNSPTDRTLWYADTDGDDFGDPGTGVLACTSPADHVSDDTDCDDTDEFAYPQAPDQADNGADNNCDGVPGVDEDQDGFASTLTGGTDCRDLDEASFPGAVDVPYDGVDQDCVDGDLCDVDGDGLLATVCGGVDCDDDDGGVGEVRWYPDNDGDSYGEESAGALCIAATPGVDVLVTGDCDDGDTSVHPGAAERCNGADDDCNDAVDDAATDALTWYRDADADNFGDPLDSVESCSEPVGYDDDADDCDDGDASAHPGAIDLVDGTDHNCDGVPGVDADGDGSADFASGGLDCDDANVGVQTFWYYPDVDGDGFGDPLGTPDPCLPSDPSDVQDDGDCDDSDAAQFPGQVWYADVDGDGFGGDVSATCSPAGPTDVLNGNDCDDAEPTWYPGVLWFLDSDGDGAGGGLSSTCAPAQPSDVINDDDCDDGDPAVQYVLWYFDNDGDGLGGAAASVCVPANASDVGNTDDCDDSDSAVGQVRWHRDNDGDLFGDPNTWTACQPERVNDVLDDRDCDDGDWEENPGAIWYVDADGDGSGSTFSNRCERGLFSDVSNAYDCDDANPGMGSCGYTSVGVSLGGGCGMSVVGTAHCWGQVTDRWADTWTVPGGSFYALSVGDEHACAIDGMGIATCWGSGLAAGANPPAIPFGQIAGGSETAAGIDRGARLHAWGLAPWLPPFNAPWRKVSLGDHGACAIDTQSKVHCFNDLGDLSPGPTALYDHVAANYDGGCGIEADGSVSCFGTSVTYYDPMDGPEGMLQLSLTNDYGCGITENQSVHCWGNMNFGAGQYPPDTGRFIEVQAGYNHACALAADSTIVCWGTDLGIGNLVPDNSPW